jgi:PIN domain nuclease of toxin-antitoxin system
MKHRVGKMPEAIYLIPAFENHLKRSSSQDLPFTLVPAFETSSVSLLHGDPFDAPFPRGPNSRG